MEHETHVLLDCRGRYLAAGLVLTDRVDEAIPFAHAVDAAGFATRYACTAGLSVHVVSIRPAA